MAIYFLRLCRSCLWTAQTQCVLAWQQACWSEWQSGMAMDGHCTPLHAGLRLLRSGICSCSSPH